MRAFCLKAVKVQSKEIYINTNNELKIPCPEYLTFIISQKCVLKAINDNKSVCNTYS